MIELLDHVEGSDAAENLLNKHKQITWSQNFLKEDRIKLKDTRVYTRFRFRQLYSKAKRSTSIYNFSLYKLNPSLPNTPSTNKVQTSSYPNGSLFSYKNPLFCSCLICCIYLPLFRCFQRLLHRWILPRGFGVS